MSKKQKTQKPKPAKKTTKKKPVKKAQPKPEEDDEPMDLLGGGDDN